MTHAGRSHDTSADGIACAPRDSNRSQKRQGNDLVTAQVNSARMLKQRRKKNADVRVSVIFPMDQAAPTEIDRTGIDFCGKVQINRCSPFNRSE